MNKETIREAKTIEEMIKIYCRGKRHIGKSVCAGCLDLLAYAKERLTNCVHKINKPTCKDCTIHCYAKEKRELIREIMKYSGPKMLFRHPILSLHHLLK